MAKMIDVSCEVCGKRRQVRLSDRKRGWGRFCSKRCKAIEQEKRTGQYRELQESGGLDPNEADRLFAEEEQGWADLQEHGSK